MTVPPVREEATLFHQLTPLLFNHWNIALIRSYPNVPLVRLQLHSKPFWDEDAGIIHCIVGRDCEDAMQKAIEWSARHRNPHRAWHHADATRRDGCCMAQGERR